MLNRRSWLPLMGTLAVLLALASCEEEGKAPPKEMVQKPTPTPLDTIIPAPKKMEILEKQAAIERAKILVIGAHERFDVAVSEINDRITSLGSVALETETWFRGPLPIRGTTIFLLSADQEGGPQILRKYNLPVTPDKPGKEGYVIRFVREGNRDLIFLAGSDPQGALYAAVTFRHMIGRREGKLSALAANITDWPDLKLRQIGTSWAEARRYPFYEMKAAAEKGDTAKAQEYADQVFACQKEYIDWMLRHKINFTDQPCRYWRQTPEAETPFVRQLCKRINDYAKARGIGSMVMANACIWTDQDGDNPDAKACVYHPSHHMYYCWSRLDYHRKRAKAFAEYLRDCDFGAFYLHATDGGGWQNPALWNGRCAQCKKIYGDDHAKADSVVYGIYYDEIKKLVPGIKFVAVIYPYSSDYLNPDYIEQQLRQESGALPNLRALAHEVVEKHKKFLRRINDLLPKDIYVCIRESTRENIDRIREVYGKRNFHLYYEYEYWKGWRPIFVMTPRWTKTFLYPGYEDFFYGNNSWCGLNAPTQMYAAECAWNTDGPGRWFFPGRDAWMDPWNCLVPRDVAQEFLYKACRDFWGEQIGPHLVPFFMGNISFYFIQDPEEVAGKCKLTNLPDLMRQQADAASQATASFAEAWAEVKEARKREAALMTPEALSYFTDLYRLALGCRVCAGFKARMMEAREAVIAGEAEKADLLIERLRETLKTDEQDLATLRAEMKDEPCRFRSWRKNSAYGAMALVEVKDLLAEVAKFEAEREALFTSYNIPNWFKDMVRSRTLCALETKEPISVDGKLSEAAWKKAPPIEHFVYYKSLRLASRETVCRILYDAQNLYFGFECSDPDAEGLKVAARKRDEHLLCDSVEVLLDPALDKKTFYHWIVDAGGNLFDAAQRPDASGALAYSPAFDGNAKFAVGKAADRWTAELAIPFSDLGGAPKPGAKWGANVCRNICHGLDEDEAEETAAGYMDGKGFHTVELFPTLTFVQEAPPPARPDVSLKAANATMAYETTGDGAGTRLALDLTVETDATLHEVSLDGEMWSGEKRLGGVAVMKEPKVELVWRNRRPIVVNLGQMVPGVEMLFTLKAREGEWKSRYVFGQPARRKAAPARFVPGIDGKALASPVFFPPAHGQEPQIVRHIRSQSGTVEFWMKPDWNGVQPDAGRRGMEHVLLDVGPIRYDYPYLANCRSLALYDTGRGALVFLLTNERYDSRSVEADVSRWRAGEWHHLAVQWQIGEKGGCEMAIFLDGKKASGEVRAGKYPEFPKSDEMLPIQLGAMNTGVCPAGCAMDDFRISTAPRYSGDFVPAKRLPTDAKTTALFRFDDNLNGVCGSDGKAIQAEPGSAG